MRAQRYRRGARKGRPLIEVNSGELRRMMRHDNDEAPKSAGNLAGATVDDPLIVVREDVAGFQHEPDFEVGMAHEGGELALRVMHRFHQIGR